MVSAGNDSGGNPATGLDQLPQRLHRFQQQQNCEVDGNKKEEARN